MLVGFSVGQSVVEFAEICQYISYDINFMAHSHLPAELYFDVYYGKHCSFLKVLTCLAWYMYTCSLSSCMFRGVSPVVFGSIISSMCDVCQNGKHSVTVTMGLLQIYALNKVMTDLEYKSFEELVRTKGLNE